MKLLRPLTCLALVLFGMSCKRDELIIPDDEKKSGVVAPATSENVIISGTIDPITGEILNPVAGNPPATYTIDENWSQQAVATLQSFYNPTTALWGGSWTVSASSLSALVDFIRLSGSKEHLHVIANVFEKNKAKNFITSSYEANASWAITWLKAYDLVGDKRYLETAKIIADDIDAAGWTGDCGGGVITSLENKSKQAVTNGLYIQLMSMLHNRIPSDLKYMGLAAKGWAWVLASGMINNANLLNNGLTEKCKNDGMNTWSHAQGIYIGAALELYNGLAKREYLDKAREVAYAAVTALAPQGALKEVNDKACGTCLAEERLYKGIFIRNLRELQAVIKDPKLGSFLDDNINLLWNSARSSNDLLGFHWQGPFDSGDAGRQASGVDLLNAAIKDKNRVNLALNRVAQVSSSCAANESAVSAVDGSAGTKWCAMLKPEGASLVVDLGSQKAVKLFKVLHAAAGGESLDYNTRNFEISTGDSASGPWKDVVVAVDNTSSATFHKVDLKTRYIRLHVSKGGTDGIARIYEFAAE